MDFFAVRRRFLADVGEGVGPRPLTAFLGLLLGLVGIFTKCFYLYFVCIGPKVNDLRLAVTVVATTVILAQKSLG